MIYHWKRSDRFNGDFVSKEFPVTKFECHCRNPLCDNQMMSKELIGLLDDINTIIPIDITSAYRCHGYQLYLKAKGLQTSPHISQHELGMAADLFSTDFDKLKEVVSSRFKSIGYSKRFIHVDMRSDKVREWFYKD